MSQPSLEYYFSIFRNNPQLIPNIKELLLADFKSMESRFFSAAENNDLAAMKEELHKMSPIVSNLNFAGMLDLLEKYRHSSNDLTEMTKLHDHLKACLSQIYVMLGER
jgi:hypothetical protein